ncbi:MAG: flagellar biosynthesis protein FliQ [Clostridia bacterium]|nr:flagellar biosynthesis protein FliQ [Clostridia bacterium]
MSQTDVINVFQQALYTIILISAPILGVSLVVGLAISIFQATTQINEQTLSFAPKIISIFITLIAFGPWMLNKLIDFTNKLFDFINMAAG